MVESNSVFESEWKQASELMLIARDIANKNMKERKGKADQAMVHFNKADEVAPGLSIEDGIRSELLLQLTDCAKYIQEELIGDEEEWEGTMLEKEEVQL